MLLPPHTHTHAKVGSDGRMLVLDGNDCHHQVNTHLTRLEMLPPPLYRLTSRHPNPSHP